MIGRILWDIIKFCIKFGWPIIAWLTFLLTYAGTVEPYIPAAYRPVVMVAVPLGYLSVAFLTGLNAMLFVAGALCLWYGLDAAFLMVSAGANQVASGDYTFWQIATSHFYVLTGLLALLTTAGGVFGVVYAIPRLRKVATAVTSLGAEKLAIRRANSTAFGNSDWVPRKKVEEMSEKPGLVLAQLDDKPTSKLIRLQMEAHAITIAPTRTGKGLLINANLLMPKEAGWEGPILSADPKGQTFHIVAKHRTSLGRRVVLVDPYGMVEAKAKDTLARYGVTVHSAVSDRFNFLDFIPRVEGNPCKIRDDADLYCEAILNGCFIPDKNGKYFQSIARGLLEALIFWVIETESDPANHHLGRVYDILTLPWEQLEAVLKEMLAAGDSVAYGICAKGAAPLLNAADKERGSHLNTAADALKWVKYPRMRAHIETSTFDIEDLCDDKIDIFVVIPPSGLDSESPLRLWVRLWATLPLLLVQQKLPKKRVLLVLDEAPAIGRLSPIITSFRLLAGYNLSVWLISQTIHDMITEYGKDVWKALMANAEVVQFFSVAPTDHDAAKEVSDALGEWTGIENSSNSGSGTSAKVTEFVPSMSGNEGESQKLVERRLLRPNEIRSLDPRQVITMVRSGVARGPILSWQARYFERPETKDNAGADPYRSDNKPANPTTEAA